MSGLSDLVNQARRVHSIRDGWKTSEFWGKTIVQVVLAVNSVASIGIDISDATAWLTIGSLEGLYILNRVAIKGRNAK